MPDLFIHIGTHKTGSTSIQYALSENAQHLKERGYVYINLPFELNSQLMVSEKSDPSLVKNFREKLDISLEQKGSAREQYKYILSFEGYSGNPDTGFRNANVVSEILRAATYGFHVRIIVYLRRQDEFLESMYTQRIHQGESFSFNEYLANFNLPDSLNYKFLVDRYADQFGQENVFVRRYETACRGRGLVADFYNVLGLGDLPIEPLKYNYNPSYSRVALEIARATNPKLDAGQRKKLRTILQASSAKQRGEPFHYFRPDERARFLARYSESNAQLAKDCLGTDSDTLFPEPTEIGSDNSFNSISPEDVAPILAYILVNEPASAPVPKGPENPCTVRRALRNVLARYPRVVSAIRTTINVFHNTSR
jgi:hypothetical protein